MFDLINDNKELLEIEACDDDILIQIINNCRIYFETYDKAVEFMIRIIGKIHSEQIDFEYDKNEHLELEDIYMHFISQSKTIKEITFYSFNSNTKEEEAEGAKAIGKALKSNTCLEIIRLQGNEIGAEGAKAIAEELKSNSSLKKISLKYNYIEAEGAKAIGKALKFNNSMK